MSFKFFNEREAERRGADHQLLVWMRDDEVGIRTVKIFHNQVLLNRGRVSVPVQKGGLVSLFVDKVTLK